MTATHLTMVVLKADGARTEHQLKPSDLDALQKAVGGYIETVPFWSQYRDQPCVVFCNEEGKLDGLPYSFAATEAWNADLARQGYRINPDHLVGDIAIIFGAPELMAEL